MLGWRYECVTFYHFVLNIKSSTRGLGAAESNERTGFLWEDDQRAGLTRLCSGAGLCLGPQASLSLLHFLASANLKQLSSPSAIFWMVLLDQVSGCGSDLIVAFLSPFSRETLEMHLRFFLVPDFPSPSACGPKPS